MEQSLPTERLQTDSFLDTQTRHAPMVRKIPRKQVPDKGLHLPVNGGETTQPEAKNLRNVDNATHYWEPASTKDPGQNHDAQYRHCNPFAPHEKHERPQGDMQGRLRHISLLLLFLVVPLFGITTALLVVIYQRILPPSNLADSQSCSGLLVDYGASQLTSISGWISTTATLLAPAYMALLSYPIARSMSQGQQKGYSVKTLPSPYQTSLLIELLGGDLMALWESLRYMCLRKRARLSKLVPFGFASLFLVVLLSILVQLADFWLHRATDSILYQVSQPMSTALYGRKLSPYCQNYYDTDAGLRATCSEVVFANGSNGNPPCSVICGDSNFFPTAFAQGYLLANSLPTNNSLAVIDVTADISPDGAESVVALLPSGINSNITWTAATIGVSTSCESIADKCDMSTDGSNIWFTCGPPVPPIGYNSSGPIPFNDGSVGDPNSTSSAGYWLNTLEPSPSDVPSPGSFNNPWIFGLGMNIDAYIPNTTVSGAFINDNDLFALMMCNSTTYELEYAVESGGGSVDSSNSTNRVTIKTMNRSSEDVHKTVQGVIAFAEDTVSQYLQSAMLGSVFSSNSSAEVLRRFEQEYSKVALSFAAPSFEGLPTTDRNFIEQRVVSCVSKAPLWSLVVLVCAYLILAVILAVVAVLSSNGNNIRSAQSQLSVTGMTAAAFEESRLQYRYGQVRSIEELFQELNPYEHQNRLEDDADRRRETERVGFTMNETGLWTYEATRKGAISLNPIEESQAHIS